MPNFLLSRSCTDAIHSFKTQIVNTRLKNLNYLKGNLVSVLILSTSWSLFTNRLTFKRRKVHLEELRVS
jgi:hypothetical protein